MIQFFSILFVALAIIIPLGPYGIDGLSQLSGIHITWGQYDLRDDGATIYAEGIKDNCLWQVFCIWKNGLPQMIMTNKVQDGI